MNRARRQSTPAEIDAIASDWIVRSDSGLSEADRDALERWRAADPRHQAALDRHGQAWSLLERPRHARRGSEMVRALSARATRRRRRVAGTVVTLLVFFAGAFSWRATREEPASNRFVAQLVLPEKRILPDGGTVELKPGAEISVDYSGSLRRVTLRKGEALFHVAENKDRPFVVTAGGVDVRAVGTAFLVAMGGGEVDVMVTHGQVAVEKPALAPHEPGTDLVPSPAPFSTLVNAGRRVTVPMVREMAAPEILSVSPTEMTERLAWCGPRVEFKDTALSDAVALMNRHSKLRLKIDDPALAKLPVNGLFRVDNTETLVRLLEAGFGVQAERRGDTVTLRKAR